jgi:tetratricopeptide (TPR) repeat protein
MPITMHPELEQGYNLFNEGKLEEALQATKIFEKLSNITQEDKHSYRMLKGNILLHMGRLQESLRIIEHDYQESIRQDQHLFLIDAILLKFFIMQIVGGPTSPFNLNSEIWNDIFSSEKLFKSITQETSLEVKLREGYLLVMRGYFFYWQGDFDKAIELHKKSLAIFENYEIMGLQLIRVILNVLGSSYLNKGELDLALDSLKKGLDLYQRTTVITNVTKGVTYASIGEIYFQKGDLDQAIRYFEKSVKTLAQGTDLNSITWSSTSYEGMIKSLLYKESREEAQKCIDDFFQYLGKKNLSGFGDYFDWKDPKNFPRYRLSNARILASRSRVRDRAEAEYIAKKLLEDNPTTGLWLPTTIFLCELYFEELKTSNDLEILEEIEPLVGKLIKEAERLNSFSLRAYAYLLKGIISLLRLNMGDARRYLTEAQQIADSHSLQLLARRISYQHDRLLEQLEGLESYKKKKLTIQERINMADLDDLLDLMQGRETGNIPHLVDEEPVLLLIISEGGILLFSYPFSEEVKIEDELFGGFLSAITAFSDEAFSEELDRVKFGQYTVLMENIAEFSFCYLFKGQTYVAQKKFSNFTENFQKNTSMMQILNKYNHTSQVIELRDFPFLEGFIKEIFINR